MHRKRFLADHVLYSSRNHHITHRRETPTQQRDTQAFPHGQVERLLDVQIAQRDYGGAHAEIPDAVCMDRSKLGWGEL
jgi:hypothetical protein